MKCQITISSILHWASSFTVYIYNANEDFIESAQFVTMIWHYILHGENASYDAYNMCMWACMGLSFVDKPHVKVGISRGFIYHLFFVLILNDFAIYILYS